MVSKVINYDLGIYEWCRTGGMVDWFQFKRLSYQLMKIEMKMKMKMKKSSRQKING